MAKCYICAKSLQFGHNVSHSKRHTNRVWRPNLRPAKLQVDGKTKRVRICTRCLRTQCKSI